MSDFIKKYGWIIGGIISYVVVDSIYKRKRRKQQEEYWDEQLSQLVEMVKR